MPSLLSSSSRYLSNLLTQILVPNAASHSKHHDTPLFTHEHMKDSHSLSSHCLRLTTELLVSSIRSSLRSFNPTSPTQSDARVLLLGSHAGVRSGYVCRSRDMPSAVYRLSGDKRQEYGGVFWCEDVGVVKEGGVGVFDAIVCWNVRELAAGDEEVMNVLSGVLKPGGVIAGVGLFQKANADDNRSSSPNPSLPRSSSLSSPSLSRSLSYPSASSLFTSLPPTLFDFRSLVESHGFFMHTCVDLSLEGAIASYVEDDARATLLDLSPLHAGLLFPARFLATKAVAKKQSKPVSLQSEVSVKEALNDASVQRMSSDPAKMSVENQLWSLSNALQSLPHPFHTRSPSACSYTSNSYGSAAYDPICVTGISLGLPNALYPDRSVFSADNFAAIFRGDNFISALSTSDKQRILAQNVCQVYKKNGQRIKYRLQHDKEVIQVAAMLRPFDLQKEYPYIPSHVAEVLDSTYALAIAAGLEALKDAGLNVVSERSVNGEVVSVVSGLPEHMQDETGVIFASSFPALDSMTSEVTKSAAAKARKALKESHAELGVDVSGVADDEYEYDRKLLFKLLVMANSQLAELIKARGPNTHINNACSGTTQAIAVAEDWIKVGRCKRVIVISADHATSDQLFPYLATGFLALGAATTLGTVQEAAAPFDVRRRGMILGAGAIGMVVEQASGCAGRAAPKVEVLGTCISNSAFHASLMDAKTTSTQLNKFITAMEEQHHIDRHAIASDLIYFSHETCTHSNGGCAKVEMDAVTATFAASKQHILLANTKGFTGHPMGVGMEDVIAVQSLHMGLVPPIANHEKTDPLLDLQPDQLPLLGGDGRHDRHYVLRFAAGFGSQFAYVLYRKYEPRYESETDSMETGSEAVSPSPRSPLSARDERLVEQGNLLFGVTGTVPLT